MRIKKMDVKGLFGMFNYSIPLNLDERLTIIHAFNGKGKTTMLRLIDGTLGDRLSRVRSVPFDEFSLNFDDGTNLTVFKTGLNKSNRYGLKYVYTGQNGKKHDYKYDDYMDNYPRRMIEEILPFLTQFNQKTWLDRRTGITLDLEDIIEQYGEKLPIVFNQDIPEWFKNIRDSFHVNFVTCDRLKQMNKDVEEYSSRFYSSSRSNSNSSMVLSVRLYAEELKNAFESTLAKSAALSQELDRTFPTRLINKQKESGKSILSESEIHSELKELERRRNSLKEVGLLDSGESSSVRTEESVDEHTRRVLSLYIQDSKEKLDVFNDMEKKINLLKEIINKRFQDKEMVIDRNKGFVFRNLAGKLLKPELLSSGEQHELVLNYEMLFRSKSNSLILIDEPEISLHITWQKEFLNDLLKIAELTEIDILIATHSPDIINGRWDLTCALEDKVR